MSDVERTVTVGVLQWPPMPQGDELRSLEFDGTNEGRSAALQIMASTLAGEAQGDHEKMHVVYRLLPCACGNSECLASLVFAEVGPEGALPEEVFVFRLRAPSPDAPRVTH